MFDELSLRKISLFEIQKNPNVLQQQNYNTIVKWAIDLGLVETKQERLTVDCIDPNTTSVPHYMLDLLDAFLQGNYKTVYVVTRFPERLLYEDLIRILMSSVFNYPNIFSCADPDEVRNSLRKLGNETWGAPWDINHCAAGKPHFRNAIMYDVLMQKDGRLDEDGFLRYLLSNPTEQVWTFVNMGGQHPNPPSTGNHNHHNSNTTSCDSAEQNQSISLFDVSALSTVKGVDAMLGEEMVVADADVEEPLPAAAVVENEKLGEGLSVVVAAAALGDEEVAEQQSQHHISVNYSLMSDEGEDEQQMVEERRVDGEKESELPTSRSLWYTTGVGRIVKPSTPDLQLCLYDVMHKCSLRKKSWTYCGPCCKPHPTPRIHMDELPSLYPGGYPMSIALKSARKLCKGDQRLYDALHNAMRVRSQLFANDMND